ncbi:MAG: sensor histidine kinase [Rubricoccaceae bacterium]
MSGLLCALARAFNPAENGIPSAERALRALRLGTAISAALIVPMGLSLHASSGQDPMALRIALSVAMLGLLGASFRVAWVRRRARRVLEWGLVYPLLVYSAWLAGTHRSDPNYVFGYFFVFVGIALVYGLSLPRLTAYGRYLLSGTGLFWVTWLWGRDSAGAVEVNMPFVMLAASTTALMLFHTMGVAGMLKRELIRGRSMLAEAETLAGTGSWELDLRTGERVWSEGARRLLGVRSGPLPSISAFVSPEDARRVEAARQALLDGAPLVDLTHRCTLADGTTRHVRMLTRLGRDAAGHPRRFYGACVDVTEALEREAALRDALRKADAARVEAEELARMKSAFLASMSHEIRTPLTSIIGFAQLLGDEVPEEHRDLVEPIEHAGRRLLDTLNSVLDLARLEAGHTDDLACEPLDAAAEARGVAAMLQPQAAARGIALFADAPAQPVPALADRAALSRVLINLAGNAIKFTEAGHVALRVRAARPEEMPQGGPGVALEVEDTGCGIPPELLARVFEPFQQASTGWARTHEGAGLGLAITQRLVEAMGGGVSVQSTAGVGSTFTVVLRAPEAGGDGAPPAAASAGAMIVRARADAPASA